MDIGLSVVALGTTSGRGAAGSGAGMARRDNSRSPCHEAEWRRVGQCGDTVRLHRRGNQCISILGIASTKRRQRMRDCVWSLGCAKYLCSHSMQGRPAIFSEVRSLGCATVYYRLCLSDRRLSAPAQRAGSSTRIGSVCSHLLRVRFDGYSCCRRRPHALDE